MTVRGDYDPNCQQIFKGTVRELFKYDKNYGCKIEKKNYKKGEIYENWEHTGIYEGMKL